MTVRRPTQRGHGTVHDLRFLRGRQPSRKGRTPKSRRHLGFRDRDGYGCCGPPSGGDLVAGASVAASADVQRRPRRLPVHGFELPGATTTVHDTPGAVRPEGDV